MALAIVKTVKVQSSGNRMEPSLLLHQPTKGLKMVCARGLAATTQPINSLPAFGSNWTGEEMSMIKMTQGIIII